ncbi:MAG: exo-alpha-sialidase, partial [bacterium]|nr:exo-alpha-sialidase [Candidatus Kapabacteria bacterium]
MPFEISSILMRVASPSIVLALILFFLTSCAFAQVGRWEYIDGVKGAYSIVGKHRDDGTVFLGTSGGLYVLDPGSDRWRIMSNGLPHALVASIAFGKPREIVVALENPFPSVYRSTDDGASWTLIADADQNRRGMPINVRMFYDALACDPISGDVALGTTSAVYRLRAGESVWKVISPARQTRQFYYVDSVLYFNDGNLNSCGPGDAVASVVGIPSTTSTIVTFAIAPGGAFYKLASPTGLLQSTDKGLAWTTVNAAPPDQFTWMSFISDNSIIAGYAGRAPYRSDDGGVTWTSANIIIDSGSTPVPDFVVAGPNIVIAAGGLATSRSLDDARTFRDNTEGLRSRYARAITGRIGTPLYISYGLGKMYSYTPTPPTLVDLRADLALTTIADDGTIYGVRAAADSVSRSTDGGATWKVVGRGANFISITSIIAARGRVYVATKERSAPNLYAVWRSSDRGETWGRTGGNYKAAMYALAVDSLGSLYTGSDAEVLRFLGNSVTFSTVVGGAKARALAVSPDNTVYGVTGGTLWRLRN